MQLDPEPLEIRDERGRVEGGRLRVYRRARHLKACQVYEKKEKKKNERKERGEPQKIKPQVAPGWRGVGGAREACSAARQS